MSLWKFALLPNIRKDKTQKVVLRVFHKKRKFFDVKLNHQSIYLTLDEWNKLGTSNASKLRNISAFLNEESKRIDQIIASITGDFTFKKFEEKYLSSNLLSASFDSKIKDLKNKGQWSTMNGYSDAKKSFIGFRDIEVSKIDSAYIDEYINQVGNKRVYLRYLRHIIKRSGGTFKFRIKAQKKAFKYPLLDWELKQLISFKSHYYGIQKSVDVWLMGYYGGGMNTKDWVYLKHNQLNEGYIAKIRSKSSEPLIVPIIKPLKKLIDKYTTYENGDFVFGFIDHNLNPEVSHKRYKTFLGNMYRDLKKFAAELEFKSKLTPYVSRHTHASVLLNKGVDMKGIQESLGQSDIRSTQAYARTLFLNKRLENANLLFEEEE